MITKKYSILYSLFVIFLCFSKVSYCQYWMYGAGSIAEDEALSVTKDINGNLITTGYFGTIADFSNNNTLISSGASDIFLLKSNPDGDVIWVKKAGGFGEDRGQSVKTDSQGNIYVTGFFYGTATFGTQTITSAGAQDVFIAKYNPSGNLVWVVSAGGAGTDIAHSITLDVHGNITITGQFTGTSTFGTATLTSMINPTSGQNVTNIFVAHYNNNGNFLWVKQGSSIENCRGISITTDAACNIFTTGEFSDTIQFDVFHNNNINNAIYVMKFDSLGNEKWFKRIGGSLLNAAHEIVVNSNQDVLITGNAAGTLYFFENPNYPLSNTYSNQAFVAEYSNNGNLLWAVSDGSESDLTSMGIVLGNNGDIYITGEFRCKFSEYADVFGQGTFNSVGFRDIFVTKFDPNGQRIWMRNLGGKMDDFVHGITLINDNPVLAGGFHNVLIAASSGNTVSNHQPSTMLPANTGLTYCGDSHYGDFTGLRSSGYNDIFLVNAIDLSREPYDYYKRYGSACERPYVGCCINSTGSDSFCEDSVEFCGSATIAAASNTSSFYSTLFTPGPNFNYVWSTGDLNRQINVTNSGHYYVTVTSQDGCFQSNDSIVVTVNSIPEVPWISDNLGIGINSPNPYTIEVCSDSIVLTAGNVTTSDYYWSNNGIPVPGDSLAIFVPISGTYTFTVVDSNGCINLNNVTVNFIEPFDDVAPYLLDVQDSVSNDTIFICEGEPFIINAFDSITDIDHTILDNPVLISDLSSWTSVPVIPVVYGSMPEAHFIPSVSGNYLVTYLLIRQNICDTDTVTVSKNFYVNVFPKPSVSIAVSGLTHICPGDSLWLTVCCASNYTWQSSANFLGDPANDSILVYQPGSYSVGSSETNIYGCSASDYAGINVGNWSVPQIQMSPASGLICPNGIVTLTTTSGGSQYEWYGPAGLIPTNLSSIQVNAAGYYFCIVTMPDGCRVSSNTVEVKQYVTPFLLATPNEALCPDDSVMLTLVTNPGSNFVWQPPLSGNSYTQIILTPGYYSCQVNSCGITTMAGVTIIASFPVAQISALGPTTFCSGDSVTLLGNSGMEVYDWHPGGILDTTMTVYTSGDYYLVTSDLMGCDAVSNVITVNVTNVQSPVSEDDTICSGQTATLNITGSAQYFWYDSPSAVSPVGNGPGFTTPDLTQTTTYWIRSEISGCQSDLVPVTVTVLDSVTFLTPSVSSNSPVCAGETLQLYSDVIPNVSFHWSGPNGYTASDQNPVIVSSSTLNSGIYSLFAEQNGCLSYKSLVQVVVHPLPPLFVSSDTTICFGDSVSLFASGGDTIHWVPSTGLNNADIYNPTCHPDFSTNYNVTVTDLNSCSRSDNIQVSVIEPNVINVTNSMEIVVGENVQLNVNYTQGGTSILWSPSEGLSCTTCSNPFAMPMHTTEYTVLLVDSLGCFERYGTVLIEVKEEYTMDVPSAFTPNGDGSNDIVYVRGWGLKKLIEFNIYNRWGEMVFSSDDFNAGWDGTFKGKLQNIETYVYTAKAETYNGLILEKHGYIQLLR